MRIFHELIIDDFVEDTNLYWTKIHWAPVMGNFEDMRAVLIADRISGGAPTVTVTLYEDVALDLVANFGNVVLINGGLTAGQTTTLAGAVNSSSPSMPAAYAYPISYILGGTTPKARLRMWITGRGRV